ncbi:hypothetical protein WP50_01485, partial [Lactiplantibacillus plantarum]
MNCPSHIQIYNHHIRSYRELPLRIAELGMMYWQGKSSNPMLQRIYGTAFLKQKDLDADLKRRQEAREHDHLVIGNELYLFIVEPKVVNGLPYWMPNGATIRRQI